MQRWLPGVETIEVEVHMATYTLFATDHGGQIRLPTGSTNIDHATVVEVAFR